jgi:quercetin dioxygenase-like cupin family protein
MEKDQGAMSMRIIDIYNEPALTDGNFTASVVIEHDQMKVRRIELASGARIPPCQMQEDVVFVVVHGRVTVCSEGEEVLVTAPGAVFIPGGATTRSMEAQEASFVLAVLCRSCVGSRDGGGEVKAT